ncbi:LacI family DNA-binding transcriptional regulator [Mesorhizobium sp. RP14(2022)]|uniref:LacI family DNA-binding transcriptional regulator n=1 Tax=Mesorhizobium liriopis TaxID=2953882 RepID=A0ABT1C2I2_9HYPH|nr:LacI family DNA-binding transcriptional regulator [Mesorhizobium liriopis]
MQRPTIADLAAAAGVSVATVNRVLSGSTPVRSETVERVSTAANLISFHASGLIQSRQRNSLKAVSIGILLQAPQDPFYQLFTDELRIALVNTPLFRASVNFDYWLTHDPDEIASRLQRLAKKADAVAMVSPDHPLIASAVSQIEADGTPVFTLLSDCAPAHRTAYIGVDNRRAGRMAGWTLSHCAREPGKIAILVGSHRFHGHELREIGLRSFLREHAPDFAVLETLVNDESMEKTETLLRDLLAETDDLVGVFLAGGGTAGAARITASLPPERRLALVSNDAPTIARPMLMDGSLTMTIAERVSAIGAELVQAVDEATAKHKRSGPGQRFVPFDLMTSENV